jgi:hypothetical protein
MRWKRRVGESMRSASSVVKYPCTIDLAPKRDKDARLLPGQVICHGRGKPVSSGLGPSWDFLGQGIERGARFNESEKYKNSGNETAD